jgi:hypothetical protein
MLSLDVIHAFDDFFNWEILQCEHVQAKSISSGVLTMRYCTVELDKEKSKCAGFGQENNSFGSAHLQQHSVRWLVKGAAQLCTCRKRV